MHSVRCCNDGLLHFLRQSLVQSFGTCHNSAKLCLLPSRHLRDAASARFDFLLHFSPSLCAPRRAQRRASLSWRKSATLQLFVAASSLQKPPKHLAQRPVDQTTGAAPPTSASALWSLRGVGSGDFTHAAICAAHNRTRTSRCDRQRTCGLTLTEFRKYLKVLRS